MIINGQIILKIYQSCYKKKKNEFLFIMASGPITLWQLEGEVMETMTDFIFSGSKITADAVYSHEIKRRCSLEEKL